MQLLPNKIITVPRLPAGGSVFTYGVTDALDAVCFSDGSIKRGVGAFSCFLYPADLTKAACTCAARLPVSVLDTNIPELTGLLETLNQAIALGFRSVTCLTDSFQAVENLQRASEGRPSRYPQVEQILKLLPCFRFVEIRNIPNHYNKEADSAAKSLVA